MDRMKFGSAGLALAITLLIVPETVRAQNQIEVEAPSDPRIEVSYADLNLARAAGRKALDQRVRQAAERLCIDSVPEPLKFEMDERDCRDRAIAGASEQVRLAANSYGSTTLAAAASTITVFRK